MLTLFLLCWNLCGLQDELKLALRQGSTLSSCIKDHAARSESQQPNPDELENQTTVERYSTVSHVIPVSRLSWWFLSDIWLCFRLLAQLDETENAFEQFWSKHHVKLEQCLQLRHFEQDFREVELQNCLPRSPNL